MNLKRNENSSTFLMKVHDNDPYFVRCDYAIVEISKDLLELISKLRKSREETGNYQTVDWSCACHFLNQDEFDEGEMVTDEMLEELETLTEDNYGTWKIDPVDMEALPQLRTVNDTVVVCSFGIHFTAVGKYSGVEYSTEKISWEEIDNL